MCGWKNMNKGKVILAFSMIAVTLTGCGVGDVGGTENAGDEQVIVSQDGYENSLDGLCRLLSDNEVVSSDAKEMSAGFIGAQKGVKYQFKVKKSMVNAEVYDYGKEYSQLDDSAKKIIDNAKANETIVIAGEEFPAVVSGEGRYLMIYNDLSSDKDNVSKANKAKEIVKNFKH